MTTAAVIDVGSNATRLLVVGIDAIGREITRVYKRWPIRLGPDVFASGRIAQNTLRNWWSLRGNSNVDRRDWRDKAARRGDRVLREANNGKEVAELIAERTGIELEIITGVKKPSCRGWRSSTQ